MDICLRLSIETCTPVPFWLSLPINDLMDWTQALIEIKKRRPKEAR